MAVAARAGRGRNVVPQVRLTEVEPLRRVRTQELVRRARPFCVVYVVPASSSSNIEFGLAREARVARATHRGRPLGLRWYSEVGMEWATAVWRFDLSCAWARDASKLFPGSVAGKRDSRRATRRTCTPKDECDPV